MITLTPYLAKAIEIAAACVEKEFRVCRRLDPRITAEEVWAGMLHSEKDSTPGQELFTTGLDLDVIAR